MNRRDFLKGMGVGAAAAGVATVARIASTPEVLPPVPTVANLDELWPLVRAYEQPGYKVDSALVRKAFQYAAALPDNPMAILPVVLILRAVVQPSKDPKFKSACINSPEFIAFVEKFGKYIA